MRKKWKLLFSNPFPHLGTCSRNLPLISTSTWQHHFKARAKFCYPSPSLVPPEDGNNHQKLSTTDSQGLVYPSPPWGIIPGFSFTLLPEFPCRTKFKLSTMVVSLISFLLLAALPFLLWWFICCHDQLFVTSWTAWLLCPWDFPRKSTRVGSHFLLQGIFLIKGLNLCLLHCRRTLYCWATRDSLLPRITSLFFSWC